MAVYYGQIAIIPKGVWSASTEYKVGNLVEYNGSSYIARVKPPVGTVPTNKSYWQVSAQGGNKATSSTLGVVKPDGTTTAVDANGTLSAKKATSSTVGVVKPDGNTTSVDTSGNLSVKKATAEAPGIVKPDGTTTTVDDNGVLSAKKATQNTLGLVKGSAGIKVGADGNVNVNTSFTQAATLANIVANEAIGIILGKVSKAIATTMNLDQNALLKNMLSNVDVDNVNKIPTSAYIHTLVERIGMGENLNVGANLTDAINSVNRDFTSCFSFEGNYTAGSLSDIIISLISNNKPCGYVFAGSGVSGLPSGYLGFVEYQSDNTMTSSIPIVLRMYNKYPVYGQIMLDTKAIEWNSDFSQFATSVSTEANTSVWIQGAPATRNYTPLVISHSSTVSCNETVSWESGKWFVYSTVSQAIIVNFFKYPE